MIDKKYFNTTIIKTVNYSYSDVSLFWYHEYLNKHHPDVFSPGATEGAKMSELCLVLAQDTDTSTFYIALDEAFSAASGDTAVSARLASTTPAFSPICIVTDSVLRRIMALSGSCPEPA